MTQIKRGQGHGGKALKHTLMGLAFVALSRLHADAATASGTVSGTPGMAAISGARVTLFTPNLKFFREVRSDAGGNFQFANVPAGRYRVGASAPGRAYNESALTVSGIAVTRSIALGVETEGGRWSFIGNTAPELIDGTGSGRHSRASRAVVVRSSRPFSNPERSSPVKGRCGIFAPAIRVSGFYAAKTTRMESPEFL